MSALAVPVQGLYLPGTGFVPVHVSQAMRAVREYDPDLSLARNEQTGDWVILLKRGPMPEPQTIFGLGSELPPIEEIKRRLFAGDVRRHGAKIYDQIERENKRQKHIEQLDFQNQTGQVAEAFAWGHRKMGTHPSPRVFVPKEV